MKKWVEICGKNYGANSARNCENVLEKNYSKMRKNCEDNWVEFCGKNYEENFCENFEEL